MAGVGPKSAGRETGANIHVYMQNERGKKSHLTVYQSETALKQEDVYFKNGKTQFLPPGLKSPFSLIDMPKLEQNIGIIKF